MPQINIQEAEKSLVEMGQELKTLERDLEQVEEMAGRYGEAITLGQVRASAEGKIERLHQDRAATLDALHRALEEQNPPSVCDYSSDGVLCNHGLNDLGVCVDSYCPVRVSATAAGREALAEARAGK